MIKELILFVVFSTFTFGASSAAVISGYNQTTGGQTVELSGLEWLSWDETAGLSRSEIENGIGNSFISDGWRYATRAEFSALFSSVWGGLIHGWHSSNFDGAEWLHTNLTQGLMDANANFVFFGLDNECNLSSQNSCVGHYNYQESGYYAGQAYVRNHWGVSNTGYNVVYRKSIKDYDLASALVRSATVVPLPAALPLLAGGLGFLGFIGWRRMKAA